MDIQNLKSFILDNKKIEVILNDLGCHHIKHKDGYITCSNPDGDNQNAVSIYENNNLTCVNYTRDISNEKSFGTDIFSLIEYYKKCSFFEAIKYVCDVVELDYYHDFDEDLPKSLKLTKMILEMQNGQNEDIEEKPLKPISEKILTYYKSYVNDMFMEDGVTYSTQKLFEVGYDPETNRITIPIRDELGTLVGIKGRYYYRDVPEYEQKFMYLERCARSKILYGLDKTYQYIKNQKNCYIVEAEKGCMQLWSYGYCNSVSIGGKKITKNQIEKLTRLCTDLTILFDKDVKEDELQTISSRFVEGVNIYAVIDDKNILNDKESPTDNKSKFEILNKQCKYKIK